MKPFNLQKAKEGAQVVTPCGSKGYYKFTSINQVDGIWHFFSLEDKISSPFKTPDGVEHKISQFVIRTNDVGEAFRITDGSRTEYYDLSMAPIIVEKWINIYCNIFGYLQCSKTPYCSRGQAMDEIIEDENQSYVNTVLIEIKEC